MGKILAVLGTIALGIGALFLSTIETDEEKQKRIKKEEEERRIHTSFDFDERLTMEDFQEIVRTATAKIDRISDFFTSLSDVDCKVTSVSGISEWWFTLDFNDYGKLTGNYWITEYGNASSMIPERLGELIKTGIQNHLNNQSTNNNC